jgi:hypothetical protein
MTKNWPVKWQTLETKARFIQQVMRGETSVRAAEDLECGALTYAEIKAIASGNPAVVEKIKIDTEVRKLDQLRAVHANEQRRIRWEIRDLPRQIMEARQSLGQIESDISTRNANSFGEFELTVGNRVFFGKGAREEAANALTRAVLSWRDDQTLQPRGLFRGFEILSRGKSAGFGLIEEDQRIPDLLIRGNATYSANLNLSNPLGTIQSIEHTLRNLDKLAGEQQARVVRIEKELTDYQSQCDRPFEHEQRLKELLARQTELLELLDLDKGDQQAVEPVSEPEEERKPELEAAAAAKSVASEIGDLAKSYMRESRTAIAELPIVERTPPTSGSITGKAVAKTDTHLAIATAANSFVVLDSNGLPPGIQIGEKIAVRMQQGRLVVEQGSYRAR